MTYIFHCYRNLLGSVWVSQSVLEKKINEKISENEVGSSMNWISCCKTFRVGTDQEKVRDIEFLFTG